MTIGLLVLALVCFIIAALGTSGRVRLVPLGVAFVAVRVA